MEKVTMFRCARCMHTYSTEEECKKCEESHVKPAKMQTCYFADIKRTDKDGKCWVDESSRRPSKYPMGINILMEDGKVIEYKIVPQPDPLFEDFAKTFDTLFDRSKTKKKE